MLESYKNWAQYLERHQSWEFNQTRTNNRETNSLIGWSSFYSVRNLIVVECTFGQNIKTIFPIGLLVPAVVQGYRNVMEVDTREIEEDAAKNSILMYDPDIVEDIKEL